MGSRSLNPDIGVTREPNKRQQIRSEQLLMEIEAILYRMSGLLRILAEEIAVFEYFLEKYRLKDTDLESF